MLRSQTGALASNLKINIENLRWYAAFHNESHHPHIHLIAYSVNPNEGYLSEQGVENLRSAFARQIFAQDLISIYQKQTENRNKLRSNSKTIVEDIVNQLNNGEYDNPKVEELLRQLSDKLSNLSGKKQYGYLKAEVKDMVDNIIIELSKDERIAMLYDIWYEQKEEVLRTYTDTLPERIPLVDNEEFRTIKNQIIKEALRIEQDSYYDDEIDIEVKPTVFDLEPVLEELTVDTGSTNRNLSATINNRKRLSAAMCSMSLLHYLSRIIQNQIEQNRRRGRINTERKTHQKTEDKKFGLGLH